MLAILRREFKAYFSSAIGYIFLAVFYAFSGFFFIIINVMGASPSMTSLFSQMLIIFIFLIPILTMRTMSEEKKQKTDQLLLTSPVSLNGIVGGKFLAAFGVYALGILSLVVYSFIIALFTTVDAGAVFCNVLGILLLGAALISIGLFVSSLTENQVISAVASFLVILMLYLIDTVSSYANNTIITNILTTISVQQHYTNFSYGTLNISDLLFYLSITAIFLFLSVRVLEKRRWS